MKKFARLITAALLAVSFVAVQITAAATAGAATTTGAGNGLKISPVRTDLTIQPGTSQTITVTIQNVTDATATFQAIVNDFVAGNNENGQPSLILNANQYAPSHSLKRYIAPIADVTVPAGQSKEVKVTINMPKDAAGGGYFGAVRFAPASSDGSSDKNVTLSASVGSLILVKVPGNIVDNMTISSFDVRGSTSSETASSFYTSNKSLYAVVRFQNKGNVQEQPFGKVVLKKGSKVLQTTEINNTDPRGNVLPDSIRRFGVQLTKVGHWGKYTLEGNFGYGSNGQLLSASTTFYVVPVALIIAVVVLVVIIILLIFLLPKAIKRYDQRVLKRAGRR